MTRSASAPLHQPPHIGIFDSGVGGLSILHALLRHCAGARFSYVADTAYAPYGQRSGEEVLARSQCLTRHLLGLGADAIVVACNTATTQTIHALRHGFAGVPFVGVEPGVKPAAEQSPSGRIGVMATPGTLASPRFELLVQRHARHCAVTRVPCPGLASAIEQGLPNPEVEALLDRFCAPLREAEVDVVALGCTHYPFVADGVAARLGAGVRILDTAEAVARRTHQLLGLAEVPTQAGAPEAHIRQAPLLQTTGSAEQLAHQVHRLLGRDWPAQHVSV